MNKKDLTDLGIAEDIAEKVVILHGKDIEAHKTKLATLQTEAEGYKSQLTEATKQIEGFKSLDVEGVKKAADEWKSKAEQAQADAAAQLQQIKFDHAIEKALTDAKVKDIVSVRAHLKSDALKLNDDGSILGLKEQLDGLKSSKEFLFESDTPQPEIITGGKSKSVIGDSVIDAARKAAGLDAPK